VEITVSALKQWCRILALLLPCLVAGAAFAQSADNRSFVMKLATATLNDGQHEWMKRFAASIEAKSGGRIKAELYPASQLGTIPRMIEATQLGAIQMYVGPPEFLVGVDRRFELLSAPGLFRDDAHAIRTVADPEFAKAFLSMAADKGLIGADLFVGGPYAVAMRVPFRTLADLRGKKIRVLASAFQTEQIAKLGGTGVPLSLGDVLPALQQGTIDGSLSNLGVMAALRYYEVAKYVNEPGQATVTVLSVLSRRWFDALPSDLQPMVLATAREMGPDVSAWTLDFLARQRKTWVEKGGEIDSLSPADKAEMMAKIGTIGDDIVKAKPQLRPTWDMLRAAAKRSL
jgi:TRAP-type C4-dicarboxylate transport system substrate-binding protein